MAKAQASRIDIGPIITDFEKRQQAKEAKTVKGRVKGHLAANADHYLRSAWLATQQAVDSPLLWRLDYESMKQAVLMGAFQARMTKVKVAAAKQAVAEEMQESFNDFMDQSSVEEEEAERDRSFKAFMRRARLAKAGLPGKADPRAAAAKQARKLAVRATVKAVSRVCGFTGVGLIITLLIMNVQLLFGNIGFGVSHLKAPFVGVSFKDLRLNMWEVVAIVTADIIIGALIIGVLGLIAVVAAALADGKSIFEKIFSSEFWDAIKIILAEVI